MEISSLPSLFSTALSSSYPFCYVLVFSSLFIDHFFVGRSVCPGGYAVLSQGWLREYSLILGAQLFGLKNVSQADLELVSGGDSSLPAFSV
jgi:hypothetical protein